jgi:hypothetical protein
MGAGNAEVVAAFEPSHSRLRQRVVAHRTTLVFCVDLHELLDPDGAYAFSLLKEAPASARLAVPVAEIVPVLAFELDFQRLARKLLPFSFAFVSAPLALVQKYSFLGKTFPRPVTLAVEPVSVVLNDLA